MGVFLKRVTSFLAIFLLVALTVSAGSFKVGGGLAKFFGKGSDGLKLSYGFTVGYDITKNVGLRGNWHFSSYELVARGDENDKLTFGVVTMEGIYQIPVLDNVNLYAGLGPGQVYAKYMNETTSNTYLSTSVGADIQVVSNVWLNISGNMLYNKEVENKPYRLLMGLNYAF